MSIRGELPWDIKSKLAVGIKVELAISIRGKLLWDSKGKLAVGIKGTLL